MDWHQKIVKEIITLSLSQSRNGLVRVKIGHHFKFDLSKGFPATTAKKLHIELVAKELQCFLRVTQTKKDFHDLDVHIWDKDMERMGMNSLGPIYGENWRNWFGGVDQLRNTIERLKQDPTTRRAVITNWNPTYLHFCVLPPCPIIFQFNILHKKLYTSVYQRSADLFLGLPFDIAQYAIISRLVANELELEEANLDYHISNLHLYETHLAAAQMELKLKSHTYPTLILGSTIDTFSWEHVYLENYNYSAIIKATLT